MEEVKKDEKVIEAEKQVDELVKKGLKALDEFLLLNQWIKKIDTMSL